MFGSERRCCLQGRVDTSSQTTKIKACFNFLYFLAVPLLPDPSLQAMELTDQDLHDWMASMGPYPVIRGVSYGKARREVEDEPRSEFRPPALELGHFAVPAPAAAASLPTDLSSAEEYVKTSFAEKGILGIHHKSTVALRNGGIMWRMNGTCPIHGVPHGSNHWVIINSPGYNTSRLQCMKTLETKEVHRFPLL